MSMPQTLNGRSGSDHHIAKILQMAQNTNAIIGGFLGAGAQIISGNGAPTIAQQLGTLYIRRDGVTNTLWYLCLGGTSWVPILNSVSGSGIPGQHGQATGVASDGSAETSVSFSPSFGSAPNVVATVDNGASGSGTAALSCQVDHVTTSGFKIYVTGGAPSSTVSVNWVAAGT